MTDLIAFVPPLWLQALHWLASMVVLAESLNKLQRSAPCARGLSRQVRATVCLRVLAWLLLAVGGAGALVTPLMHLVPPTLPYMCPMLGFAVLIVRTRVKEG